MILEDLLQSPVRRGCTIFPDIDPLRENDVLQEAQLLDVRFMAVTSTVGLLFECRTAIQLREANTAILVARGLREFTWLAEPRSTYRTAWNIVMSNPSPESVPFVLELSSVPESRMRLVAEVAEFYFGDVVSLMAGPPDYGTEDSDAIQTNLACWQSEFALRYAAHLNQGPR